MLDVKLHNLQDSRFEPDRRKLENLPYAVSCYVLCSLTIIIINICVQVCSLWWFVNCGGFILSWIVENPGLQLIMAILPERDKQIYPEIKRVGDNVIGIPTQCVQSNHVHRTNPQVCANIALKINSKLGGINHVIVIQVKNRLFFENLFLSLAPTSPTPPWMKMEFLPLLLLQQVWTLMPLSTVHECEHRTTGMVKVRKK